MMDEREELEDVERYWQLRVEEEVTRANLAEAKVERLAEALRTIETLGGTPWAIAHAALCALEKE